MKLNSAWLTRPLIPSAVIVKLAEQILGHHLPKEEVQDTQDLLTVFQFCSYLEKQGVTSLDMHITELAKEGKSVGDAIVFWGLLRDNPSAGCPSVVVKIGLFS